MNNTEAYHYEIAVFKIPNDGFTANYATVLCQNHGKLIAVPGRCGSVKDESDIVAAYKRLQAMTEEVCDV